ncbi:uncharacterized protein LOC111048651 isoform X3 [Nilaparvata lugens]|nr:uncharacterized protein LOC111048651 isoform X3 [Nilaparvata lugens]
MTLADKWEAVRKRKLCFNCLKPFVLGHPCSGACRHCGKAHHSLLHGPSPNQSNNVSAISTLESLGIEQAKVITMTGFFKIVSEEDYESEDLKRRKEKEKKLAEENVVGDDLV